MKPPLAIARPPVGEDVDIFVISSMRCNKRSSTLQTLQSSGLSHRVKLIVPATQTDVYKKFAKYYGVRLLKPKDPNAKLLPLCGKAAFGKFVVLRDDMTFFRKRRNGHAVNIGEHFNDILICISRWLDEVAAVSMLNVGAIEFCKALWPRIDNAAGTGVYAYRRGPFLKCPPSRVPIDYAYQLAGAGYEQSIITEYAYGSTRLGGHITPWFDLKKIQQHAMDDIL